MSNRAPAFVEQFSSALRDYLDGGSEAGLEHAYELGRVALASRLGVLEVAAVYQEALAAALLGARNSEDSALIVRRASDFLAESLSPFEMTHRGFQETISKLLALNESLRISERKHRSLLNAIPDEMFRISRDGLFLDYKGGTNGGLGASPEQVIGKKVSEVLPDESARQFMQHAEQALEHGVAITFEYRLARKRNEHYYEARIVASGKDEVLGIVRDITGRKRAEEERAQLLARERAARTEAEAAERRLAFLAAASKELALSFDYEPTLAAVARLAVPYLADLCIVDVIEENGTIRRAGLAYADRSKQALIEELRRYPPEPSRAEGVPRVLRAGRPQITAKMSDARLQAIARNPEHLRLLRALGPKASMVVPLRVHDRILGALALVSVESGRRYAPSDLPLAEDFAGRAALAVESARLYRQLQKTLRLRDEFLTAAAHELRTPATSLKGYVQFLQRRESRDDQERQALAVIGRAAERTARLVRELVEAQELEEGRVHLQATSFDLAELAQEQVRLAEATGKGHRFVMCAAGPVRMQADRERLALALEALLENAVRYQPQGGSVRLSVAQEGDEALVEVRDFGVGIAPDRLGDVFEPLFEPWLPGSPHYVGVVGLGLYLARRIVEAHGGHIAAESKVGEGSTFRFRVPLTVSALAQETGGQEAGARGQEPRRLVPGRPRAPSALERDAS